MFNGPDEAPPNIPVIESNYDLIILVMLQFLNPAILMILILFIYSTTIGTKSGYC